MEHISQCQPEYLLDNWTRWSRLNLIPAVNPQSIASGETMSNQSAAPTELVMRRGSLPRSENSDVFTGAEHGDVPVSMFLVHSSPGSGPGLHRHPYPEVFVINDGLARFQLGEDELTVGAGDVVIAPAGVPHRFTCTGPAELRLTAIHTASRFETEWLQAG
jgi:quercetin dioxygenase-like cupin family protein